MHYLPHSISEYIAKLLTTFNPSNSHLPPTLLSSLPITIGKASSPLVPRLKLDLFSSVAKEHKGVAPRVR